LTFDRSDPMNIEIARASPMGWSWYAMGGPEKYNVGAHHELVNEAICECVETFSGRLLIEMGPRLGKSRLAAVGTAGWVLGMYPHYRMAVATGSKALAKRHGRTARNEFRAFSKLVWDGLSIDPSNDAVDDWGILGADGKPTGGGFRAYGVGSAFSGEGADVLSMDDLVVDAQAAGSPTIRQSIWDWLDLVAYTRLEKGASVIGMTTRWHEDDPHGRIRLRKAHEGWRIIRIPSISEGPGDPSLPEGAPGEPDPLGRPVGVPVWPWKYDLDAMDKAKAGMSSRGWNALHQQRPAALEGNIWKAKWWRKDPSTGEGEDRTYKIVDHPSNGETLVAWDGYEIPLSNMMKYVVVDLATTAKKSADYTSICVFGLTTEKPRRMAILDLFRRQMEGPDINPMVRTMLNRWNARIAWYEKEGQQATVIQYARRAGIPAKSIGRAKDCDLQIAGDKVAVAEEATPFAGAGRLLVPAEHPFLADWEHEVLTLPNAKNDDFADTFAWAIHIATRASSASILVGGAEHAPRNRRRRLVPPRARGDALDDMGPAAP